MASTQLGTSTLSDSITHGRNVVLAGSRLYATWTDGTNVVYQYSDDDGASWSTKATIDSGTRMPTAFYDATNGRLNFVYAGGNSTSFGLRLRAITSNVTSGTPGALTTTNIIDAGGTNSGVVRAYAFHSDTGTNPRYWIIALKVTASSVYETRVWYCDAGSAADVAANWTNGTDGSAPQNADFKNLGGTSDANTSKCGVGVHWQVASVDGVTFVMQEGSADTACVTVTFDPTAATPTPGTVGTVTGSTEDNPLSVFNQGALIAIGAVDDYLVFGCHERTAGTWDFFKTVDGTTWTAPTGWDALTMGYCQITTDGTDFYLLYSTPYGVLATADENLEYRKLTKSSDAMGSGIAFSDTQGNAISAPPHTGTAKLYALYRGSTASPYTVRSDFAVIEEEPPSSPQKKIQVIRSNLCW